MKRNGSRKPTVKIKGIKRFNKRRALLHGRSSSASLQLQKRIENLSEWRRRLSVLMRYGKKAATETDLDALLKLLVDEAKEVLNAERATVFLVDHKKAELWSLAASGTEEIRIPLGSGIAGAVATSGELLNIRDVYRDARFNSGVDKKTGFRTRSVLSVPMFDAKNHVIGVFQVLNPKDSTAFDRQDEELMLLLADQAAGQVENAQLYQEIRKVTQETIFRLAAAVEFKDHDTRAHLWRMSQYSAFIAEQLGFGKDFVEAIRMAAPMHDIGKIGVPDAILNKPGKLNPEEWEEMKKHPIYGAEILKDSDNEVMQMSASVALHHHEKWDGSGYPKGLKGEAIPVEARIASLADVFDALTSKRVYKPSFGLDETLDMIKCDSGKHFDPKVVDAFFRALPKITGIMEKYTPRGDQRHEEAPLTSW